MSSTIWVSIGFVLGAFVVGTSLTQRVEQCVQEYQRPCTIHHTWTRTSVQPDTHPNADEGERK